LNDPWFSHCVCYICDHDENGSMGLVINKPLNMALEDILSELHIRGESIPTQPVLQGGPVSPEQGFILYQGSHSDMQNMEIANNIRLTTSKDILQNIADGAGPEHLIVCLGYAGWEAGQLEAEIAANSWLTIPADEELLFHTPTKDLAQAAAKKLGVDLNLITSQSGHA
ncbi:MAG: YqgE/AlgH family protein, partial [Bermanella sp.]